MSFLHVTRRPALVAAARRRFASTSSGSTATPKSGDAKKPAAQASVPVSSCPPDTLLKGLNYLKGQPPVLALADDQYPAWLWSVLKAKECPDDGPGGQGERMKRKKERQQAIKDRNFMSTQ